MHFYEITNRASNQQENIWLDENHLKEKKNKARVFFILIIVGSNEG